MTDPIPAIEPAALPDDDTQSIASSSTSLNSSIYDYRRLHGRPYKAASTGEYWAPVDQIQNEAFDVLHHVHLMISDDKLFRAPISPTPGFQVLDVGTGTGVWAIDFAEQFPNASVTGTDIAATQPSWIPANCKFVIDDCILDWTWPVNHFDFVHIRALYGSIPDWKALYANVFARVKPGGWFEHVEREVRIESDHVILPKDHVWNQWADLFHKVGEITGRSFGIAAGHTMKELMEEAGFVDVVEKKIKMPMHGWPKDPKLKNAGYMAQVAVDEAIDGLGTFVLTQIYGWTREQVVASVADYRGELRKMGNYAWLWV